MYRRTFVRTVYLSDLVQSWIEVIEYWFSQSWKFKSLHYCSILDAKRLKMQSTDWISNSKNHLIEQVIDAATWLIQIDM